MSLQFVLLKRVANLHIGARMRINQHCIPTTGSGAFDVLRQIIEEENFRSVESQEFLHLAVDFRRGLVHAQEKRREAMVQPLNRRVLHNEGPVIRIRIG